jgi:subtilisin
MNLSLSSKSERLFPFFHEVVDEAYFKHVALVSAVNNVPGLSFPSTFSSVFSVAAHAVPDPDVFFYNPSPPVEWGGWGVDVPVAWKDGGTTVATGNSFAAPHMAGIVTRIVSKHPALTPFEIKAVLAAIADNPRPEAGGGSAG